jgi:hypothetical protein
VSLNDGSAAYGATDLTVMSQSQASQISQLCWQIRQVEEKFGMGDSRVVGPEVDAGPWLAAVEALDGRDAKQALADLTKALTAGISLIGGVD